MAYNWKYSRVGGITRVYISSPEDLRHLGELDKKMWTVLSCPVSGLEIDEQSLRYIDANNDGSIRVDEVISVSSWLSKVLNDLQVVVDGKDTLALSALNQNDEEGKKLYDAAVSILSQVGKEGASEISLADSSASLDSYRKQKLEAALAAAKAAAEVAAPYGDKTDAISAAHAALDAKVRDYFMRLELMNFSKESTAALDVQVASIESIAAENLTAKVDQIATYPLARIQEGAKALALDAEINPAWSAQWAVVKEALAADAKEMTLADWNEIGGKLQAFADYQKSLNITEADITLDDEAAAVQLVDKLLHLTRDFFTLLRNYVTLQDLYNTKKLAIFQAGTLIVDQRSCDMCVRIADAGAMAAQAGKSNLYLITCNCVSKSTGKTMSIAAAMTVGDVDDLFVGKNCIFYDRAGVDYDARITAIIDNPISIRQAMWSPYKKMANLISEQIDKFASKKEAGVNESITTGVNEKTETVAAVDKENAKETGKKAASFDIGKYVGIFAAVGMAIGLIGTALASIFGGFVSILKESSPLKAALIIVAVILGIIVIISGPSMFIAWRKLKKRNLAPVLNANGWAVNAAAKINVPFGNTLTQRAKYPVRVDMKDPFAEPKHTGRKILLWILAIIVILAIIAYMGYSCGASLGDIANQQ